MGSRKGSPNKRTEVFETIKKEVISEGVQRSYQLKKLLYTDPTEYLRIVNKLFKL
jgi:hypothetical protein